MISGHFSSFSSFMPILVLVEKVVRLFCAQSYLCHCPLEQQIKPLSMPDSLISHTWRPVQLEKKSVIFGQLASAGRLFAEFHAGTKNHFWPPSLEQMIKFVLSCLSEKVSTRQTGCIGAVFSFFANLLPTASFFVYGGRDNQEETMIFVQFAMIFV